VSSKPKILFLYESKHPILVEDGLWTALNALETTFYIKRTNLSTTLPNLDECDFVLGWGAFGSGVDRYIQGCHTKKKTGLCIGGNGVPLTSQKYDVLFYETKWVRDFLSLQYSTAELVQAFGYNDLVYKDLGITEKDIDYLGVGAFADWKRWELMKNKKGRRKVIGEFQKGNPVESQKIWDDLSGNGVLCEGMIVSHLLNLEYNRAKTVYIPANIYGGGERAILEARACGCSIEIEPDNPKLKELLTCEIPSHLDYAQKLKFGIELCL